MGGEDAQQFSAGISRPAHDAGFDHKATFSFAFGNVDGIADDGIGHIDAAEGLDGVEFHGVVDFVDQHAPVGIFDDIHSQNTSANGAGRLQRRSPPTQA